MIDKVGTVNGGVFEGWVIDQTDGQSINIGQLVKLDEIFHRPPPIVKEIEDVPLPFEQTPGSYVDPRPLIESADQPPVIAADETVSASEEPKEPVANVADPKPAKPITTAARRARNRW